MSVTATAISTESRVYVGTYHKYNCGSIAGNWLNLADYDSYDEFIKEARDLHRDEIDPELMPQDWEGIGQSLSESGVFHRVKMVYLWAAQGFDATDAEQADAFWAFVANNSYASEEEAFESFETCFAGWFDSLAEFAAEFLSDSGKLAHISDAILRYFDYSQYANDLDLGGTIWYHSQRGRVAVFWNR